ncbi:hypothetical protein QYE76_047159 [Lolium multiflorum]|uniref:DUF4218 domain-containing protein n=1 Tax=Lolium multiflorum TaxID=4521 RepID=A0AAD8X1C5_LOLMU|nr:hypothetical protein QYE76_047159 [Lolium multiflorum]
MKRFILELGVVPSALDPFVIYCDNMGAIANAQEPRSHKRLKHIKLRYHSIREYIEDGELSEAPPDFYRHRHHAVVVGFKRSYYFRCPLEREVDVVFINNRTCDRVRRCCPFVAPEPIVIKIFYALLQAASERLPQQQEPPLVGFGISSRSLLGTLMNMPERIKDGPKARTDLNLLGLKKELQYPTDSDDDDEQTETTQILPVAMRGIMDDHVRETLFGLCNFFDVISRKSIGVKKLNRLQEDIVEILCELEIYFPPAFFDIVVHLLVHVVDDIIHLGPTFLHNMMPFERLNGVIKGFVRNRARPDGSIAKGFLTYECISFCQNYLSTENEDVGLPTRKHVGRLAGFGHHEGYRAIHVGIAGRHADFDRAHRVALQHIELGPGHNVRTYQSYDINGYRFYTEEKYKNSEYQNSGVTMLSYTDDKTDVKERFYGRIEEIWKLDYVGETMPMFRVRWAKSVEKDGLYFTTMVIPDAKSKTPSAKNEPWVLASQVDQCFFITDPSKPSRVVVRRGKRSIIEWKEKSTSKTSTRTAIRRSKRNLTSTSTSLLLIRKYHCCDLHCCARHVGFGRHCLDHHHSHHDCCADHSCAHNSAGCNQTVDHGTDAAAPDIAHGHGPDHHG